MYQFNKLNTSRLAVSYTHLDVYKRQGYGNEIKLLEWLESKSGNELLEDKEYIEKNETLQKLGAKSRKEQLEKFAVKQKKQAGSGKRKKAAVEPSDNDILSQMTKKRKTKKE